jgi:hypothetical protein
MACLPTKFHENLPVGSKGLGGGGARARPPPPPPTRARTHTHTHTHTVMTYDFISLISFLESRLQIPLLLSNSLLNVHYRS